MTNNTKQGLIVIGLSFGLVLVVGSWLQRRELNREDKALDTMTRSSMEQSYQDLIAQEANVTHPQTGSITTADVWTAFCDKDRGTLKFTGYYRPTDVFLAKDPVKIGAPTLLCAAQGRGSVYGINAAGVFRPLTNGELNNWPHVSAKDIVTNR